MTSRNPPSTQSRRIRVFQKANSSHVRHSLSFKSNPVIDSIGQMMRRNPKVDAWITRLVYSGFDLKGGVVLIDTISEVSGWRKSSTASIAKTIPKTININQQMLAKRNEGEN